MVRLFPTLSFALAAFASADLQAKQEVLDQGVRQFMQTYCIQCHGGQEDKGDGPFTNSDKKRTDNG